MKKVSLFLATAVLTMALASCGFKTTAKLNNEIDSVNYAVGFNFGNQIKSQIKQQVSFDKQDTTKLESFYKSFLNGFNANFKKLPEGKFQQFNGIGAGMDLAMKMKEGFLFGDSTWTAKKDLIQKFALEVINGKDTVGGFTAGTARGFYSKINREKRDTVTPFKMTPEKLDSLNAAFAVMMSNNYLNGVDSVTKGDFAKGFKKGLATTNEFKRYQTIGSLQAAYAFKELSNEAGFFRDSTVTLQAAKFLAGFNAGVLSDTTIMTPEKVQKYLMGISEVKREAQIQKLYGKNKIEGANFLAENAKREGVKVTESGLQYEVIKEGKGAKPAETDTVTVHYTGTLINDTVFDSSVKRGQPISFPLNGVIKGWTEGVQLMSVGSKYKFYIPYELAYGERGSQNPMTRQYTIEPFSTLIFDVELLGIKKFVPKANITNKDITIGGINTKK